MFLAQDRRSGQIDQDVGFLEDVGELFLRQTEDLPFLCGGAIGPAVGQSAPSHHLGDVPDGIGAILRDKVPLRVVGPRARVLDVINVESESAQALEMLKHLPGHPGEGDRAHHSHHQQNRPRSRHRAVSPFHFPIAGLAMGAAAAASIVPESCPNCIRYNRA